VCEGEAKPTPDPENVRAEYRAVVDYHTSIVNTRFTIAGLTSSRGVGSLIGPFLDGQGNPCQRG